MVETLILLSFVRWSSHGLVYGIVTIHVLTFIFLKRMQCLSLPLMHIVFISCDNYLLNMCQRGCTAFVSLVYLKH